MTLSKITTDYIYTYAAFLLMAACGIVINLSIIYFYNSEALGVFNQVYAIFILLSQLAGIGLQYSILKHATDCKDNMTELGACVWSNIFLVILVGGCLVGSSYLLLECVLVWFDSAKVYAATLWALPGIVLYNVNKSLLFGLNGLQEMKKYSFGQSVRCLAMMAYVIVFAFNGENPEALAAVFPMAESVLLAYLLPALNKISPFSLKSIKAYWLKRHFLFGIKGVVGGFMLEMNARVDVLLLGLFSSDALVGVYSFASMFVEGFNGVLAVVRTNVNPYLVEPLMKKDFSSIRKQIGRIQRRLYPIALILIVGLLSVFSYGADFFLQPNESSLCFVVLAIVLSGVFLFSGYSPFVLIFNQAGRPELQTIYYSVTACTNIFLNMLLIPAFDIHGAAIATASSFALSILWLNLFSAKGLGSSLGGIWTFGTMPQQSR